jgi:hypothetical protein
MSHAVGWGACHIIRSRQPRQLRMQARLHQLRACSMDCGAVPDAIVRLAASLTSMHMHAPQHAQTSQCMRVAAAGTQAHARQRTWSGSTQLAVGYVSADLDRVLSRCTGSTPAHPGTR